MWGWASEVAHHQPVVTCGVKIAQCCSATVESIIRHLSPSYRLLPPPRRPASSLIGRRCETLSLWHLICRHPSVGPATPSALPQVQVGNPPLFPWSTLISKPPNLPIPKYRFGSAQSPNTSSATDWIFVLYCAPPSLPDLRIPSMV